MISAKTVWSEVTVDTPVDGVIGQLSEEVAVTEEAVLSGATDLSVVISWGW